MHSSAGLAEEYQLATEQWNKIDIALILIERIDGAVVTVRAITVAFSNTVLQRWASDVPEQGKAQCEAHIPFEDSFQCRTRLKRSTSASL